MEKIIMNWDENNPKLKCKSDLFVGSKWFEQGKSYQIYRILSISKGGSVIYMINDGVQFVFYYEVQYCPNNSEDWFDGVEKIVNNSTRKTKLEVLNINSRYEASR